jgi:serine protease inhibitor
VSAFLAEDTVSVDRPFMFVIRDTKNGSILFMGHVEDPRAGCRAPQSLRARFYLRQ